MRLLRDKRGVARIIEAFLASVLLMSVLTLIPAQTSMKDSSGDLSSTAQNVLVSLDSNGHLAALVDERNWTALKNCLDASLPLIVWFNLTVFDRNMNGLNDFPICNAGAVSDNIVSVDYLCVSQSSTYTIYFLRLQLALVD
jgi:hypothetical protein